MKRLLFFAFLHFLFAMSSFANDWTDESGTVWHYTIVDGGIRLDGASNYGNSFSIPSLIDGKAIITIGRRAFLACANLTSIDALSSCTSIGDEAFIGCSSLTSVSDLSACTSIGESSFHNCTGLTSVDLSSCTSIGKMAFYGCSSLTSVGDLSACTSIGEKAFFHCSSLTSVDLSSCTSIGLNAFLGCTNLGSTGDLSACISIGDGIFFNCESLTSVDLSSCTLIGEQTFYNCSSLTSVGDLSSCTSIGGNAFYGCSSLTSVDLSSCTLIGLQAFFDCTGLTSVGDLSVCTSIGSSAFYDCSSLTSVDLSSCTSIGKRTFYGCSSLTSVGDLSACTSIGDEAFRSCSSLTSVDLSSCTSIGKNTFYGCSSLTSVGDLSACTSIGEQTFYNCSSLTSVGDLSSCTSIGGNAFYGCSSLTSVDLSSCESIGDKAFYGCYSMKESHLSSECKTIGVDAFGSLVVLYINSMTPPTLSKTMNTIVFVPNEAVNTYRNADVWKDMSLHILPNNVPITYDKENIGEIVAMENGSALQTAIKEENLLYVVNLKINGSINSYDIIVIRNKMHNLRHLDLTDATIVNSDYCYYGTSHTKDNEIGEYMFSDMSDLYEIKFPKNITKICSYAFIGCRNIHNIDIPEGVTSIGNLAFFRVGLREVKFPSTLISIGESAIGGSIENINLPENLRTIGPYCFMGHPIKELILPSSITSIASQAFYGCPLEKIYSKLIDPFTIAQDAFSCWTTATLYVPMNDEWTATYYKYYWDTQWSQFARIEGWNPEIKNFYIDSDYELESGTIAGEPNAAINKQAGFIVNPATVQEFGDVHIKQNGTSGGSLIGDGNIYANSLYSDIEIQANKWYFFCFPFDVKLSEVSAPGNYIFRYYDANARAKDGNGAWKNIPKTQEYLVAGTGYIFQANQPGTLSIHFANPNFYEDNQAVLEVVPSNNVQDASWNFVGNPYFSYYDIANLEGFTAPITIWNGTSYEVVRPGDDDYVLQPYQAFFVQKPSDTDDLGFWKDEQTTYLKGQDVMEKSKARRAKARKDPSRLFINLVVSDGENTDKTRIVFNDKHSMGYEAECDASKFMSTENVPQIYTINDGVQYAINERPNGSREVKLGFVARQKGIHTISATRMDTPMLLVDSETNVSTDLSQSDYTFESETGSFNGRFMLISNGDATAVNGVENSDESEANVYDVEGRRAKRGKRGTVIVNNRKVHVQ